MRVLMQTRSAVSVASSPGGDVAQAHETARALTSLGIDVRVSSELQPDLTGIDLVHVFNLVRPQDAMVQARHAWRHRRPVALSTVYCDMWEYDSSARGGLGAAIARHAGRDFIELAKAAAGGPLARGSPWSRCRCCGPATGPQHELIARCDVLLPNSVSELRRIERDLGVEIPPERYVAVPNAVDPAVYGGELLDGLSPPVHLAEHEGCVLCVGRVEGRKNQLNVIRALAGGDR